MSSAMTAAPLTKQSLETLIDLVEIKLSTIEICDRDDAREVQTLERCLAELATIARGEKGAVSESAPAKRRGRRPKSPVRMGRPMMHAALN